MDISAASSSEIKEGKICDICHQEKRLYCHYTRSESTKSFVDIMVDMRTVDTQLSARVNALLDCGTYTCFMDKEFVKKNNLTTRKLDRTIPMYNIDGTRNVGGNIEEEIEMIMTIEGHREKVVLQVCDLGKLPVILGVRAHSNIEARSDQRQEKTTTKSRSR